MSRRRRVVLHLMGLLGSEVHCYAASMTQAEVGDRTRLIGRRMVASITQQSDRAVFISDDEEVIAALADHLAWVHRCAEKLPGRTRHAAHRKFEELRAQLALPEEPR